MSCWYKTLLSGFNHSFPGVVLSKVSSEMKGIESSTRVPDAEALDFHLQEDLSSWFEGVFTPWLVKIFDTLKLEVGSKAIYTPEYLEKINTAIASLAVATAAYDSFQRNSIISSLSMYRMYQAKTCQAVLTALREGYEAALLDMDLTPVSVSHLTTASSFSNVPERFKWEGEVITQHVLYMLPEPVKGSGNNTGGILETIKKKSVNPLFGITAASLGLLFWHKNTHLKKQ